MQGPRADTPGPRGARGRVVMLVDNDVRGDSRVQKTARSAAEAGWEVILLGERRDAPQETWRIGDAEVRLVPVRDQLSQHPMYFRRPWLRRPFAYAPGRMAAYRLAVVRSYQLDIGARLAELRAARAAGGGRAAELIGKAALLPRRVAVKAIWTWTRFRAGQSRRHHQAVRDGTKLLTRLPVTIWTTLLGRRAWRKLDPSLWQWEMAFGKVVDELRPDIIHAHDFRMIAVGARATVRARAKGRSVKFVWDAHEYVPGLLPRPNQPGWLPALCAHEKEYARYADAVVTVSDDLADLLKREHGLAERPTVVMNAPVAAPGEGENDGPVPDLRADCGVGPEVPLLAYCGGITPVRGVDIMVEALPHLPGVHLTLVSLHPNGKNSPAEKLYAKAEELGVADRVHLLPYVPHWQVSAYLSAADAAISPLLHLPNHEIALSNKFFEYSHARLPLVVSDVRTMSRMVRSTGQGEVFTAGDLDDYLRAVRTVLADPAKYRAAYDRDGMLASWTWEAQAAALDGLYARLLPGDRRADDRSDDDRSDDDRPDGDRSDGDRPDAPRSGDGSVDSGRITAGTPDPAARPSSPDHAPVPTRSVR